MATPTLSQALHDLRDPLHSMRAIVQLARRRFGKENVELGHLLTVLERNIETMKEVTDRLGAEPKSEDGVPD